MGGGAGLGGNTPFSGLRFWLVEGQLRDAENGVREASLWRGVLGVDEDTIVEDTDFDLVKRALIARVRVFGCLKPRCGLCGARALLYDQGGGTTPVAGIGFGNDPGLARSRCAACEMLRPWGNRRPGALGSSRRWSHEVLRLSGRLAGDRDIEVGSVPVDAYRLAYARIHRL